VVDGQVLPVNLCAILTETFFFPRGFLKMFPKRKAKQWRTKGTQTTKGFRSTGRTRRKFSKGGLRTHASKLHYNRVRKRSWSGGLPRTKVRKTGTYSVVVPQSRIAPRKQRIKLEQKYMCQNSLLFGGGAVAGSCDNMFFCVNNISPVSFTNGGAGASSQNIWGLDADMGACSLANPPRGFEHASFQQL